LLRRNDPFLAIEKTLAELNSIAKTRRTPIDSYWSFYAQTQKDHWKALGEDLKTVGTAPSIGHPFFPVFVVITCIFLWEWMLPWRKDQPRFRDGIGLDVIYTVFSYVFFWGLFGTALCTVTAAAFDNFLYDVFGVENMVAIELSAMPTWMRLILLLLSMELVSYWIHRLLHQFEWAWEFHKIHHSAPQIDVFNAARLHFGERLIYQFFSYVPLSMVGFGVTNMIYVGLFATIFSNLTHANVRLPIGPLKYIINTPQLHIWHHENEYHKRGNVNFGDTLIVWDIIFGTFYLPTEPADTSQLSLGFDGVEEYPQTFIAQTILPFKAIGKSISARLNGRDESPR
jgi:sterol desaturase/sphingolipid hydroxylase (fatty acid hydroxylase superfamily)